MRGNESYDNVCTCTDLEALWQDLQARCQGRGRRNELLAGHTTLRLGGPADIWFPAQSAYELSLAVSLARGHYVPFFILGGGANLLIRDMGIRGLVIENRANAVHFEGSRVIAESGAVTPRLAKQCAQRGLSGLEWAIGIPGTIGGATVNNAGAYGQSMADCLSRAELIDSEGRHDWHSVDWFEYTYRSSKLKQAGFEKAVVLRVELDLTPAPVAQIEATMRQYNQRRRATQPPGATIGSMFKNPAGDYAGRLIEAAGLKGYRLNQAQISPVHANFFVNLGGAKTDDVISLIELARTQVKARFGVDLELEIEII